MYARINNRSNIAQISRPIHENLIMVQEVQSCNVVQIRFLRAFVRLVPIWLRQQESSWEWNRTMGILPRNACAHPVA